MASIRLDNDFSPLSRSEREQHLCSWNHLQWTELRIHAWNNLCISCCKKGFNFSQSVHTGLSKPSISVQHYPGDIRKVWQPLSTQYTVRGDLCVCYSRLRRTHSSITFLCKFKVWKEQEKKKTEKTKRWWTEADSKSLRSQVKQLDVGLKRCALLCGWPIMSAVIQPNLM